MVSASLLVAASLGGLPWFNVNAVSAPTSNIVTIDVQISIPPILERIAQCESGGEQWIHGKVVTGPTKDIGKFQINPIHLKDAEAHGYDLYSLEGNTAYAKLLYERNGTRDWNSSKRCWGR